MDRPAIRTLQTRVLAIGSRVSHGIPPFALFVVAVVVAACGKGNGGGSGY